MANNYQACYEGSTTQVLTGQSGDKIVRIVVVPLTKTPGNIQLRDGTSGTPITIYAGRGDLISITVIESVSIEFGARSENAGGWYVITGADVQCWIIGE